MSRVSLAQYFSPPTGYSGDLALVCGYSADDTTLFELMDAFTGVSSDVRRVEGITRMVLMLDGRHSPLMRIDGLEQVLLSYNKKMPWSSMHAKVALMAFVKNGEEGASHFRLVVGTGNWTMYTMNQSVDFFWASDVTKENGYSIADSKRAWEFFTRLISYYSKIEPLLRRIDQCFGEHSTFGQLRIPRGFSHARFMHTFVDQKGVRSKPIAKSWDKHGLGRQIMHRMGEMENASLLFAGAPFFNRKGDKPSVLLDFVETLSENGNKSNRCECYLTCNYEMSGTVALWANKNPKEDIGWDICRAEHPDTKSDLLHAKYLLLLKGCGSAYSGFLYLGSANWTCPGMQGSANNGGNVEAGVVLSVNNLSRNNIFEKMGVSRKDFAVGDLKDGISEDPSDTDENGCGFSGPFMYGIFNKGELRLYYSEGVGAWTGTCYWAGEENSIEVPEVRPANCETYNIEVNSDDIEGKARISCSENNKTWQIPIYASADGRLVRPPMPKRSLDDLSAFITHAHPRETESMEERELMEDLEVGGRAKVVPASYPIKQVMFLVEQLARRAQLAKEGTLRQLCDWLSYHSCFDDSAKKSISSLKVNPFAVLRETQGFAPCEKRHSKEELEMWSEFIDDLSRRADCCDLPPLMKNKGIMQNDEERK